MLASNPDLKPTTAIKSTGVSDPSTIRRLRDTFQKIKGELIAEIAPAAPVIAKSPRPERAAAAEPRTAAARTASAPKKQSQPVHAIPQAPEAPAPALAPAAAEDAPEPAVSVAAPPTLGDPAAWMTMMCGIGLQSLNTAVALQISFVEKLMKMPHVATALRGQVAFNEMTLALCPISPRLPKSLH